MEWDETKEKPALVVAAENRIDNLVKKLTDPEVISESTRQARSIELLALVCWRDHQRH